MLAQSVGDDLQGKDSEREARALLFKGIAVLFAQRIQRGDVGFVKLRDAWRGLPALAELSGDGFAQDVIGRFVIVPHLAKSMRGAGGLEGAAAPPAWACAASRCKRWM